MAEALKRQYDIVALKVQVLDTRPNVRFTLQAKVDGRLTDIQSWKSDTGDMGFLARSTGPQVRQSYADITGNLSTAMIDFIASWFLTNAEDGTPLWVHLVKPYGVLRFVPWERALGDALPVPVLMLPDFIFPPPRESSSVLDVVLCASAPLNTEHHWVFQALRNVASRIVEAQARRTRLHIFTDSDFSTTLRAEFSAAGLLDQSVFVHDPANAMPYIGVEMGTRILDATGQLRSPWLLWMRDTLKGRSVDVVHFCCHGYLTRERGALLFAQSPIERTERYLAGPVGQSELETFLTQVGAWSAAFTSVYDDNSEPGVRALADEIAQTRPGPLLMSNARLDPECAAVADAYRFLYSVAPSRPPKSSSLFMYCQPYRVAGPRSTRAFVPAAQPAFSPLSAIFEREESVVPWIASTERFAEQVQVRYSQPVEEEAAPVARNIRHDIALETVNKLRSAVARLAANEPRGGGAAGSAP